MLRFIRLLLAAVAIVVLVAFAIANRQPVEVSFAPLPVVMELPLYGVFMIGLVFGVLIGGTFIWFSALARARQVRHLRNRNWALENQLNLIKQQEEKAEAQRQASRAVAVPRAAA
jgi:lipopolysaccharide assembly protein A